MMTQSGTSQSNCCTISIADRLLPLEAQRVHRVGEVDALLARRARCTIAMQPSKSVSSASTSAPLASGCTSCAVETLPRGRSTTAREAGGRAVGRERRRGVAGRGAGDGARSAARRRSSACTTETSTVMPRSLNEPVCELPHSLTHRSSSAELAAEALGPEEVGAALVHRDDVLVADLRRTHSCLPHTPEP